MVKPTRTEEDRTYHKIASSDFVPSGMQMTSLRDTDYKETVLVYDLGTRQMQVYEWFGTEWMATSDIFTVSGVMV